MTDLFDAYGMYRAIEADRSKKMAEATLKTIREFFHTEARPMGMPEFRKEWTELSTEDKAQIRQGLTDGTLTY